MVGYVLRPSPDKGYVSSLRETCSFRRCAAGWCGSLPRRRARSLVGFADGLSVAQSRQLCRVKFGY